MTHRLLWFAAGMVSCASPHTRIATPAHTTLDTFFAPITAMQPSGRELFHRVWVPDDPRSYNGDGLGPMFNAASCTSCHRDGGEGGAGPVGLNVQLIDGGVVHLQGTASWYSDWRSATLRGWEPVVVGGQFIDAVPGKSPTIEQRNAPALWGLGRIDQLADVDIAVGTIRNPDFPEISGRAPRDADGRVTRFGWKGDVGTLRSFVAQACANELGLNVPGHDQAVEPWSMVPETLAGLDLHPLELDALVDFVGAFEAPPRVLDPTWETEGAQLFGTVGCAACHAPSVGEVDGIYSDLLVHNMGSAMAAKAGSYGVRQRRAREQLISRADLPAGADEWRTPPLWRVARTAPYMHDGRATSLDQAIRQHDGEARATRNRYLGLEQSEKLALIDFVAAL